MTCGACQGNRDDEREHRIDYSLSKGANVTLIIIGAFIAAIILYIIFWKAAE